MKIAKVRALSAVAVISALGFATAVSAGGMYRTAPDYCKKLEDNWTGSASDWANWIIMCS